MNSFRSILVLSVFALAALAAKQQLILDPTLMDPVGSGPFIPTNASFVHNNAGGGYVLEMGAAFGSSDPHDGGQVCQTVTTPATFMHAELHLMASGLGAVAFFIDGQSITTAVGPYDESFSANDFFKPAGSNHTICAENRSTTGNSLLTLVSVEYDGNKVSCRNARGVNNPSGKTGVDGPHNPSGKTGPNGASNPSGPYGADNGDCPSGETGITGPNGANNPSGNDNPSGISNPSGINNPAGKTGETGVTGATGMDNPTGIKNPTGMDNPSGTANPSGANNQSGKDGVTGKDNKFGTSQPRGKDGKDGKTGPFKKTGKTGKTGKNIKKH